MSCGLVLGGCGLVLRPVLDIRISMCVVLELVRVCKVCVWYYTPSMRLASE
jgi:hypothetical protein